jgi:hypothetical protein
VHAEKPENNIIFFQNLQYYNWPESISKSSCMDLGFKAAILVCQY